MYSKGNNSNEVIDKIIEDSMIAKQALKELNEYIKRNPTATNPPPLYNTVRNKLSTLCESIRKFKLTKTTKDANGKEIYSQATVFEMLNDLAGTNPNELTQALKDEFNLYEELGFSWEEYQDVINTHLLIVSQDKQQDYKKGFNEFSEIVLKRESKEEWKEVAKAGVGALSIAGDIVAFAGTVGALVPLLCFSCASGVTNIAMSIKSVGKKFSKIFRRRK